MKLFSTARNTQRDTQNYIEKRRGHSDIEVVREGRDGNQRREIEAVISSLSVLHSPEHTTRVTELSTEKKGEGRDRGDLVEKKEGQKGRGQSSQ